MTFLRIHQFFCIYYCSLCRAYFLLKLHILRFLLLMLAVLSFRHLMLFLFFLGTASLLGSCTSSVGSRPLDFFAILLYLSPLTFAISQSKLPSCRLQLPHTGPLLHGNMYEDRGEMVSTFIVCYALSSAVGGHVSGSFYR